ncbi:MAG TPA: hypothetical protein VN700_16950 [Vicinamibacterales bacterium]|nr:hypothetical protein [Vicinamibacterales bacterium]
MTRTLVAGIAGVVLLFSGDSLESQELTPDAALRREFPSDDWQLLGLVQRSMNAREAERGLREAPGAAATMRRLVEAHRLDDAIESLEAGTRGSFDELMAMLDALGERMHQFQMDAARGYVERVAAIVSPLRGRLATLPREDAARLAWRLMSLENQLGNRGSAGWRERLAAYVGEYRGTRQGSLAEVQAITAGNISPSSQAALDAFARAHPGTDAAAAALYQKGFDLGHNAQSVGGEKYGEDPLDRFLQVLAIVEDLETKYPDSEWARKAPSELVVSFYFRSSPPVNFKPGSIDRMLTEYQRFARSHFTAATGIDLANNLGYLLSSRMAELYAIQGDRVGGVEKSLADLETHVEDKRAVELFRAEFLLRESRSGRVPFEKADAALSTLAEATAGFYSRKAAALLASRRMYERDYSRALVAYESYVARYPASPWTWVARLRAAQCLVELGDLNRAAAMFETLATVEVQEPVAVVLGSALAAQTYEAMGLFDRSLAAYQRALASWSNDYGPELTPAPSQARVPRPATGESTTRRAITQENLADRVASLERNLKTSVGPLLERAAWQIDARRFADARSTLAQAAKASRTDSDRTAVRQLDHRAQLELAMELLAVEGPDAISAFKALDAIAPLPFDANVGFAGLAKGTVMFRNGAEEHARITMNATLDAWRDSQQSLRAAVPASPLAADIAAIRNVLFRPAGRFEQLARVAFSEHDPFVAGYVVTNPDVRVTMADGKTTRITVYQEIPEQTRTIFWTTEDIAFAQRLVGTLGRTRAPATAAPGQAPNRPTEADLGAMKFWNASFATHKGNMGQWVVQTYPIIVNVTFLDDARTKAAIAFRLNYEGATLIMEKTNGAWQAIRLVNQWIS